MIKINNYTVRSSLRSRNKRIQPMSSWNRQKLTIGIEKIQRLNPTISWLNKLGHCAHLWPKDSGEKTQLYRNLLGAACNLCPSEIAITANCKSNLDVGGHYLITYLIAHLSDWEQRNEVSSLLSLAVWLLSWLSCHRFGTRAICRDDDVRHRSFREYLSYVSFFSSIIWEFRIRCL